jgi:hypothetical protein
MDQINNRRLNRIEEIYSIHNNINKANGEVYFLNL